MFGHDWERYMWLKLNTVFKHEHLVPAMKHGDGRLMIWACFEACSEAAGPGRVAVIEFTMKESLCLKVKTTIPRTPAANTTESMYCNDPKSRPQPDWKVLAGLPFPMLHHCYVFIFHSWHNLHVPVTAAVSFPVNDLAWKTFFMGRRIEWREEKLCCLRFNQQEAQTLKPVLVRRYNWAKRWICSH